MSKIKVIGDAAVVTSSIKKTVLEQIAKFKDKGLQLTNPETKEPVFAIGLGKTASFNKHGINFTSEDADGFAQTTLALPVGMSNAAKADYVKDNYGYALLTLNTLEGFIAAQEEAMVGEFQDMANSIEIV